MSVVVATGTLRTLHRMHRQLEDLLGRLAAGPRRIAVLTAAVTAAEARREAAIEAVKQAREKEIDLRTINNESWDKKGDRIYAKAIETGLDEGTASMLKALTDGVIRAEEEGSRPVALYVSRSDGRLYARESSVSAFALYRALGRGARAAE